MPHAYSLCIHSIARERGPSRLSHGLSPVQTLVFIYQFPHPPLVHYRFIRWFSFSPYRLSSGVPLVHQPTSSPSPPFIRAMCSHMFPTIASAVSASSGKLRRKRKSYAIQCGQITSTLLPSIEVVPKFYRIFIGNTPLCSSNANNTLTLSLLSPQQSLFRLLQLRQQLTRQRGQQLRK